MDGLMKNISIYIAGIVIFLGVEGSSQARMKNRYELVFGIGPSFLFSDIGGADANTSSILSYQDIDWSSTRVGVQAALRYKLDRHFAVKANLLYGFLTAADADSKNAARGINTTTHLISPEIHFEYHFISEDATRRRTSFNKRGFVRKYKLLDAYIFAGIGGAFFKPGVTASSGLPIENDVRENWSVAASFPLGLGFKYMVNPSLGIGLELGGRYTTTDYLEGYNWSGPQNKHNDVYVFGMITASYKLNLQQRGSSVYFRR